MMSMLNKSLIIIVLLFLLGCSQSKNFEYGIKQLNSINSKYNSTMETYPSSIQQINLMIDELKDLKTLKLEEGQESFYYAVNYRITNLEAEKLYIESQKYGSVGTTKDGFACKPRPLIIESVDLRNKSAIKGFEAVQLIRDFISKYPKNSQSIGLSAKNALFLNATFYKIWQDARRDSNIINAFCPENVTLELYQQEFRKNTNFSEDFISGLNYNQAVKIWKGVRSIS